MLTITVGIVVEPNQLLFLFVVVKIIQFGIERWLSSQNRRYYSTQSRLSEAARVLKIDPKDLDKTIAYASSKYDFGRVSGVVSLCATLGFVILGGFGWLEEIALQLNTGAGSSPIITGLIFFGLFSVLSGIFGLPFEYYQTFVVEQKHGFNRQTVRGFFVDKIKGTLVAAILGGGLLGGLLWVMSAAGDLWWLLGWFLVFGFSLLAVWIYPTLLAPIFNKFVPLEDGELKRKINLLAEKVSFDTNGISVMDASTRSSHGNAYFTGVFGKKKIVLFDTLIKGMSDDEIVAVLAHELGHFKLNHIRLSLVRSFLMTGLMFFALGQMLPIENLYLAFGLQSVSNYGALVVFSLWFGPIGFLMQPLSNWVSRKNEFEADNFALENVSNKRLLGDALLKLRENSHVMPISHSLFSAVYHSHPPLMERLRAMSYLGK